MSWSFCVLTGMSICCRAKEGEAMVKEYYNIAPTIVNRIGRQENAGAVYDEIWDDLSDGLYPQDRER